MCECGNCGGGDEGSRRCVRVHVRVQRCQSKLQGVCERDRSDRSDGGQRRVQVVGVRERECVLGEGGPLVRVLLRVLVLVLVLVLVRVRVRAQRWRSASRPSRREFARASARAGGFCERDREGKC